MKWNKYTEIKPPERTCVLIYYLTGYEWDLNREIKMGVGFYYKDYDNLFKCELDCGCSGYEFDKEQMTVTHWMPLPDAPKDENK